MPNYYYDAPHDFTPDDELEIFVPMEQPKKNITCPYYLFRVNKSTATFQNNYWAGRDRNQIRHKRTRVPLPYPRGARVGVREPWKGETCKHCGRNFRMVWSIPDAMWTKLPRKYQNKCLCLECAIWLINDLRWEDVTATGIAREECHWYTVTAVDVVKRDGQWVEKVTMRSEK